MINSDSYALWNSYLYQGTNVLINKFNAKNHKELHKIESRLASIRIEELRKNPIKITGSKELFTIHHHIFQDSYEWAGKRRLVNMAKKNTSFAKTHEFDRILQEIDKLIFEYKKITENNTLAISKKLAEILDTINYLHPFREGNGRTQREFLRALALEKNFILDINPPDDEKIFKDYMTGTIYRYIDTLSLLINDCL